MNDSSVPSEDQALAEIRARLGRFTESQIEAIVQVLVDELKDRRRRAATAAALALRVGDEVENLRAGKRLPLGARGRVEKVCGASVLVCFHQLGKWKVDATLVRKSG